MGCHSPSDGCRTQVLAGESKGVDPYTRRLYAWTTHTHTVAGCVVMTKALGKPGVFVFVGFILSLISWSV